MAFCSLWKLSNTVNRPGEKYLFCNMFYIWLGKMKWNLKQNKCTYKPLGRASLSLPDFTNHSLSVLLTVVVRRNTFSILEKTLLSFSWPPISLGFGCFFVCLVFFSVVPLFSRCLYKTNKMYKSTGELIELHTRDWVPLHPPCNPSQSLLPVGSLCLSINTQEILLSPVVDWEHLTHSAGNDLYQKIIAH